ncbi:hypothetical protein [Streptomyces sp. NBC_00154]|nr:hypothetical protein [Streptomyces sp. NBC_00154]MCX5316440.1 hypothetical protein [Streptomyces sp. NBC_00154]
MTPDELRAALIGTWRLVSYEATAAAPTTGPGSATSSGRRAGRPVGAA